MAEWVLPTRRFTELSFGVWSWPAWYIGSFTMMYDGYHHCLRFGPFGFAVLRMEPFWWDREKVDLTCERVTVTRDRSE